MKPGGAPASAAVLSETGRRAAAQGGVDLPVERALVAAATRAGKVEIHRVDGAPVRQSGLAGVLTEAGFGQSPRGLVVWPRTA